MSTECSACGACTDSVGEALVHSDDCPYMEMWRADERTKQLEHALREARALLDHAGCPVDWLDKVLAGSAATDGVAPASAVAREGSNS